MSKSERVKSDSAAAAAATATAIRVGVDLGTNTTVLAGAWDGKRVALTNDIFKSVVGFPKEGIIPGILPNDKDVLIGDEAIDYRLHLDLSWVLHHGCVADCRHAPRTHRIVRSHRALGNSVQHPRIRSRRSPVTAADWFKTDPSQTLLGVSGYHQNDGGSSRRLGTLSDQRLQDRSFYPMGTC